MDHSEETLETWNKVASLYQEKFMDLDLYNETYDFICNSITNAHAKILDVGCGPGNITKYLLSKRPEYNIYGIDAAPNMIKLAKQNNPNACFDVMDCRDINTLKEKFDGIVCGFCLPYLSAPETARLISDANHLLVDDGILYISFVEGDPAQSGFRTASSGDRVYFHYHDLNDLKLCLADNGFAKPKLFSVVYKKSENEEEMHTILIAKKTPNL